MLHEFNFLRSSCVSRLSNSHIWSRSCYRKLLLVSTAKFRVISWFIFEILSISNPCTGFPDLAWIKLKKPLMNQRIAKFFDLLMADALNENQKTYKSINFFWKIKLRSVSDRRRTNFAFARKYFATVNVILALGWATASMRKSLLTLHISINTRYTLQKIQKYSMHSWESVGIPFLFSVLFKKR